MKKRILAMISTVAMILTVAMVLTFIPASPVLAATEVTNFVALKTALEDGITTDITFTGTIGENDWVDAGGTAVTELTVKDGVTLTIVAGGSLTIPTGKTLTVEANGFIENHGTIASNGTIVSNGTITGSQIYGEGTVEVNTFANLQKALELLAYNIKMTDNITIGDGVTVEIPYNVKLNTGGNSLTVAAGGALEVLERGTLIVEGELTVASGATLTAYDSSLGIIGTGTINVAQEPALITALESEVGNVKLTANIVINDGIVIADGTLNTNGHALTVGAGVSVSIQSDGALIVSENSKFTVNGILYINGTFTNNGTTTFGASSEVKLVSGGTLTNNNELSVAGTLMLIYGTFTNNGTPFTVSGTLIMQNGATLSANDEGKKVELAEGGIIYSATDFTDETSPFEIIGGEHLFALNANGGTYDNITEFAYVRGANADDKVTLSATPTNPTRDGIELSGWTYGTNNGTKSVSVNALATHDFIDATGDNPRNVNAQWTANPTPDPVEDAKDAIDNIPDISKIDPSDKAALEAAKDKVDEAIKEVEALTDAQFEELERENPGIIGKLEDAYRDINYLLYGTLEILDITIGVEASGTMPTDANGNPVPVKLEVTQIADPTDLVSEVTEGFTGTPDIVLSFDVKLTADGQEIQPNGGVKVTFSAPGYEGKTLTVAHKKSDGEWQYFIVTVGTDGTFSVNVTEFSPFIVLSNPELIPTGVSFDKASISLQAGQTTMITATVSPITAVGEGVWSSSNSAVASVDGDGNVTAKAVGSARITYTFGEVSATANVTVTSVTSPETGDNSNLALWVMIALVGAVGIAVVMRKRFAK